MGSFLQAVAFSIGGAFLLWLGYRMFSGELTYLHQRKKQRKAKPNRPKSCPICSTLLSKGELVDTCVFQAWPGSKERVMYVSGCIFCIQGNKARRCPVCREPLDISGHLVSRVREPEQAGYDNHVHIVGCNICRKTAKQYST